MKEKIKAYIFNFSRKIKLEVWETKEAGMIAHKYMKHENVSAPERKFMLVQITDIIKIVLIGIPFAVIPGASILLPVIIKVSSKAGVNLLPSSFSIHKKTLSLQQNNNKPV